MFQKQQFVNVAEVPCREAAQSNSPLDAGEMRGQFQAIQNRFDTAPRWNSSA